MMTRQLALLYSLIIISAGTSHSQKPRRSVSFSDGKLKLFQEPGFDGLGSLTVRDDIDLLFIGARGKVVALSLDDISNKTSENKWTASPKDTAVCLTKGKTREDCENYIRMLHLLDDGRMLVCGTNAFTPACTYMTFKEGNVTMETTILDGRGKVPFDPNQNFASLMNGDTLYSAGSTNFMGTEMVFQRHGENPIKTEAKQSWLNDPTMISINVAEISDRAENKEDDNVFLFLTENAVEERRSDTRLSRVARVCKSDLGGLRTLQKRWTSFLKARLDCPFGDAGSSTLVQDVFLLQGQNNWTDSVFYATFTSDPEPSSTCSQSAVCAYKLSDIRQVFMGNFLTEGDPGNWVRYTGAEPFPYPRSCINDEMRAGGVTTSLNVSDATLQFVKNHPLMEGAVTPIGGRPLLVTSATQFSSIAVDEVTSLDGKRRKVMFIGTSSGWLQKAVWSEGDGGRIIEELQLFPDAQPVHFLQLSSTRGQLYAGGRTAAVQLAVRECGRYASCDDCLVARDPYCGWDLLRGLCAAVAGASNSSMIQNLTDGGVGRCPSSDFPEQITTVRLTAGIAQFLPCSPDTNLPVSWSFSGVVLQPGPRHLLLSQGLVVTPSSTDAGLYSCDTVEEVHGIEHRRAAIRYLVEVRDRNGVNRMQNVAIGSSAACGALALRFMYRRCRRRVQSHVGCSNSGTDAGTEGTTATGMEEGPKQNNENRFVVR